MTVSNERAILFSADISPESANKFASILADYAIAGVTKLTLAMNSPGGNVGAGVFLHNVMTTMPYDIATHNIGNVDSIATVIFLAGSMRKANSNSTFMFHGVGFDQIQPLRLEEKFLKERLDTIQAEHRRLAQLVSDRTTLSPVSVRRLYSQQSTRSAAWAKSKGLISEIGSFECPANVPLLTFFG